jgi:hypothetical protein
MLSIRWYQARVVFPDPGRPVMMMHFGFLFMFLDAQRIRLDVAESTYAEARFNCAATSIGVERAVFARLGRLSKCIRLFGI